MWWGGGLGETHRGETESTEAQRILKYAVAGVETESQDLRVARSERASLCDQWYVPCMWSRRVRDQFRTGKGRWETTSHSSWPRSNQRRGFVDSIHSLFSHFCSSSPVHAPLRPRLTRLGSILWSLRAAAAAGISTLQGDEIGAWFTALLNPGFTPKGKEDSLASGSILRLSSS